MKMRKRPGWSVGQVELDFEEMSINEPFDPTQIRITTQFYTLDLLLARIRESELELSPAFQRKDVWTDDAASRLIESLLIRIPLPAFYIDASNDDRWVVIDGQQRLTALTRFIIEAHQRPNTLKNLSDLRLSGLEYLVQYTGKTYAELPRGLQRRILETQVTVSLIEPGTPEEVKFNIFRRINTGGVPLSPQEIRHALYQGEASSMLARLADSAEFQTATNGDVPDMRMTDREFVLRFIAFMLTPYHSYSTNNFDIFLNNAMKRLNDIPSGERAQLEDRFHRSMKLAHSLFGPKAFRKYRADKKRSAINKALFEAWSVNLAKLSEADAERLLQKKYRDALISKFEELLSNQAFLSSITQGTGLASRVKARFEKIEQLLQEVLLIA